MQLKGLFKYFFRVTSFVSVLLFCTTLTGQAPLLGRQCLGSSCPVTIGSNTESPLIAIQSISQSSPIGLLDQTKTSLRQGFIQPEFKLNQVKIEPPLVIYIHPNPVSEVLNLRVDIPSDGIIHIVVSDLKGRFVWSNIEAASTLHQLDLSSLSSGTYILTIIQPTRMTSAKFNKL